MASPPCIVNLDREKNYDPDVDLVRIITIRIYACVLLLKETWIIEVSLKCVQSLAVIVKKNNSVFHITVFDSI